jgi:hypothetical protein
LGFLQFLAGDTLRDVIFERLQLTAKFQSPLLMTEPLAAVTPSEFVFHFFNLDLSLSDPEGPYVCWDAAALTSRRNASSRAVSRGQLLILLLKMQMPPSWPTDQSRNAGHLFLDISACPFLSDSFLSSIVPPLSASTITAGLNHESSQQQPLVKVSSLSNPAWSSVFPITHLYIPAHRVMHKSLCYAHLGTKVIHFIGYGKSLHPWRRW